MPKMTVKKTTPHQEPTLGTLLQNLHAVGKEMKAGFQKIDQRFERIDQHFEQVDQRFERIDLHFEQVDQHFERIDQRFEQIDQRFERQDRRFEQQDQRLLQQDQSFSQQNQRFQSLESLVMRIEQELRREMRSGFEEIKVRMTKDNIEGGNYLKEMGEQFRRRLEPLEQEFPALKESLENSQRLVLRKLDEHCQALEEMRSSHAERLDKIEAQLEGLHAQK